MDYNDSYDPGDPKRDDFPEFSDQWYRNLDEQNRLRQEFYEKNKGKPMAFPGQNLHARYGGIDIDIDRVCQDHRAHSRRYLAWRTVSRVAAWVIGTVLAVLVCWAIIVILATLFGASWAPTEEPPAGTAYPPCMIAYPQCNQADNPWRTD